MRFLRWILVTFARFLRYIGVIAHQLFRFIIIY